MVMYEDLTVRNKKSIVQKRKKLENYKSRPLKITKSSKLFGSKLQKVRDV